MNIFALSTDPIEAAQMNCDVHCNKIFLESVQMITNCFPTSEFSNMPLTKKDTVRKQSHFNHPISKWIRQSKANLEWAIEHTKELERERIYRGMNPHFSSECFKWILDNSHRMIAIPNRPLTDIIPAIKEDKQCRKRIFNFSQKHYTEQYRLYYVFDKPFATWNVRPAPQWFIDMKIRFGV